MRPVTLAMAGAARGGAEAFFERLAIGLSKVGAPVQVIIRRDRERAARLAAGGVHPVELPFGGPLDMRTRGAFLRALRAHGPDVVMTFMSRATKFCPRPGSDKPFVFTARMGGYYDLKYYRHCHHLVGNTPDLVDYFRREGWPSERAHYLPNFAKLDPLPAYPRDRLSTPPDAPVILALGRLHPNKAFDVLIDALPGVPSAILWLAGAGPLEEDLREQAAERGVADRIRFLGWIDNPAPYYAACDIVAISARHEPLGNVVLEGWAAGKPVAAAASQGPGQLIRDGETGLLVPVDDATALGAALQRLVSEPELRATLVDAGRREYESHYTEEAVVRQYLEFFERVAREAGL